MVKKKKKKKEIQAELSICLHLIQVRNRLLLQQNKLVMQLTVLLYPLAMEQAFGHTFTVHLAQLSADILSAEGIR